MNLLNVIFSITFSLTNLKVNKYYNSKTIIFLFSFSIRNIFYSPVSLQAFSSQQQMERQGMAMGLLKPKEKTVTPKLPAIFLLNTNTLFEVIHLAFSKGTLCNLASDL